MVIFFLFLKKVVLNKEDPQLFCKTSSGVSFDTGIPGDPFTIQREETKGSDPAVEKIDFH